MRITIQLIENNLAQEIPTIVFTIQNQKYIFNIPETFQRYVKEHRYRFPKASNIFFTKINATSVSGLKGLMLSLFQGGNAWDTKIFTNHQLYNYLSEVRYQMGFKILPFSYYNWTGICQRGLRNNTLVQDLLKRKDYATQFHHIDKYLDSLGNPEQNINDCRKFIKNGIFKDENIEIIPFHIQSNNNRTISNYICIPNKIQGKVNAQKLNQFKVPKKFIKKLLTQGELKLDNGNIIYAKDIKQQDIDSPNFLIIHINSLETLINILNHKIFIQYMNSKDRNTQSVIYIIEKPQLVQSEQFKYFLKLFNQNTKHLLFARNYKDSEEIPTFFKHYAVVSKIFSYFPQYVSNIKQKEYNTWVKYLANCKHIKDIFQFQNIEMYKRCYELIISPSKSKGYNKLLIQPKKEMDLELDLELVKSINNLIKKQENHRWDFSKIDPKVVFLGTGSMKPSTYRNVSGIFIELDQQNSVILDCGEGTYYQLLNHVGFQNIQKVLLSIKIIFISHIHSDHNLGILNLLAQKKKLCQKYNIKSDTYLIIPGNMSPWIFAFNEFIEQLDIKCLFIQTLTGDKFTKETPTFSKDQRKNPNCYYETPEIVQQTQHYSTPKLNYIIQKNFSNQTEILEEFLTYLKRINVVNFKPVRVIHCPQSYGIIIEHHNGIKISYSGDTRPCPQFIKEAQNSTLMIHEATFGDDLHNNAVDNLHSTVKEALQSGMKSNSWRLALTHFSQRYNHNTQILETHLYKHNQQLLKYALQNAIVCFDHFQMRLSDGVNMPEISRLIMQILPDQKEKE